MVKLISIASLIAAAATLTNAYTLYAWDGNKYTGNQKKFSTQGKHSLGFKAKSYKWERGVLDTGCCINFCAGSKSTGGYGVLEPHGYAHAEFVTLTHQLDVNTIGEGDRHD